MKFENDGLAVDAGFAGRPVPVALDPVTNVIVEIGKAGGGENAHTCDCAAAIDRDGYGYATLGPPAPCRGRVGRRREVAFGAGASGLHPMRCPTGAARWSSGRRRAAGGRRGGVRYWLGPWLMGGILEEQRRDQGLLHGYGEDGIFRQWNGCFLGFRGRIYHGHGVRRGGGRRLFDGGLWLRIRSVELHFHRTPHGLVRGVLGRIPFGEPQTDTVRGAPKPHTAYNEKAQRNGIAPREPDTRAKAAGVQRAPHQVRTQS